MVGGEYTTSYTITFGCFGEMDWDFTERYRKAAASKACFRRVFCPSCLGAGAIDRRPLNHACRGKAQGPPTVDSLGAAAGRSSMDGQPVLEHIRRTAILIGTQASVIYCHSSHRSFFSTCVSLSPRLLGTVSSLWAGGFRDPFV